MADYQKMYYVVCSAASRAIDAEPEEGRRILQQALHQAEDIYIYTSEEGNPQEVLDTAEVDIDA